MKKNKKTFSHFARYYDVVYKNKNYTQEVDIIDALIRRFVNKSPIQLLEIGCGTGEYLVLFAKKGYVTTGLDRSAEMVRVARKKIKPLKASVSIIHGDGKSYAFHKKFDVIIALFDVLSYQLTNNDVVAFFSNIYKHLADDGLLIFDCWYGPRVLLDKPHPQRTTYRNGTLTVQRSKKSILSVESDTATIRHAFRIEKNAKLVEKFVEKHTMRYFFYPELDFFLQSCGFDLREWGVEYKYMRLPKNASWSVLCVAEKRKKTR